MQKNTDQPAKNKGANPFPAMEREVLDFWDKAGTFTRSVDKASARGDYVFYDGPPFATGLPHYGHIVGSMMKDAVPRYFTMQGYRIERKWGWDCHGLPIENLAEKELGLGNKQDIEKLGVEKFNDYCKSLVLRHEQEWKNTIRRIGRWVDMENDYKTMDTDYMESIWWVFKQLWEKGLIYQGYKAMHICPRCGTTLSNFEVGLGYKEVKDISATVKFKAKDLSALHARLRPEAKVYFLAWTTTPWTLIGNSALAVGGDIDYAIVMSPIPDENGEVLDGIVLPKEKVHEEFYIVAKEKVEQLFGLGRSHEIIGEVKGSDLAGSAYEPAYDFYFAEGLPNKENGWKVYTADFVSTQEGTGIVHIAPAFGETDMSLGQKESLPFIQHVDAAGRFTPEVKRWAGMEVKPKDNPQQADIEVIKDLAARQLLFAKESIRHSYPHCWRCESPLLNYASQSWFVKVTEIKDSLAANNKKIRWVPAHVKEGRFGKWLDQARDWSISRNRYWGDPLPVWQCDSCDEKKVIGSIEELRQVSGDITKIILARHGESEKNLLHIFNDTDEGFGLTVNGKAQAKLLSEKLKNQKIDKIYSSPVNRAVQTARVVAEGRGTEVTIAQGFRELNSGNWEGRTVDDPLVASERTVYHQLSMEDNYAAKRGVTGESWKDIEARSYAELKKILKDNRGQTILLVSHQGIIVYLLKALKDLSLKKSVGLFDLKEMNEYAYPFEIYIDAKTEKQIDLHKQFVDRIEFGCEKCSGTMKRIPEVLDCWFESGSMPYAQLHYPFDNEEKFKKTFPAQFIAEGMDQTRGWFYTLMVLSTALYDQPAFRNVIVNGIVLAEDGQKMSKSKGNYPDATALFEKHGVDALRYYLLSSPLLSGDHLNFSEKGVEEALRNVIMTLWNVFKFYDMFRERKKSSSQQQAEESGNVLDKWILVRLDELKHEVASNMDKYLIPKAIRPIEEFISDFSTWYLRRSRDRFKGNDERDKEAALAATGYVLTELSKVMAPFLPFISEQIWQKVTGNDFQNLDRSVHLEEWPAAHDTVEQIRQAGVQIVVHNETIDEMELARKIAELGLAKRAEAGIKVRQPLAGLKVKHQKNIISDLFVELVKDEVNVREVEQETGPGNMEVELDTAITGELKQEGIQRDIVRLVNAMRKDAGLTISDKIRLFWKSENKIVNEAIFNKISEIMKDTLATGMDEGSEKEVDIQKTSVLDGADIWLGIKKA